MRSGEEERRRVWAMVGAALLGGVVLGALLSAAAVSSSFQSLRPTESTEGEEYSMDGGRMLVSRPDLPVHIDYSLLGRLFEQEKDARARPQPTMQYDSNYSGRPIVTELKNYRVGSEIPVAVLKDRAQYDDTVAAHFLPIPALRPPYRFTAWQGHVTNHVIRWNLKRLGGFEEVDFADLGDCDHILFRVPLYHTTRRTWHRGSGPCAEMHDPLRHITAHLGSLQHIDDKAVVVRELHEFFASPRAARTVPDLDLADFLPSSFVMRDEEQCRAFWTAQRGDRNAVWVKKSISQGSGRGITYIKPGQFARLLSALGGSSCSKVRSNADSASHNFIMQQYLHPYLLHGRKFDVRAFAYVARLDPLLVYFHRGPVRLCIEPYHEDSLGLDPAAHVCNLGAAKRHPQWQREVSADDAIVSFNELKRDLDKRHPGAYQSMLLQMKSIMIAVLRATTPNLTGQPGQFELIAFDFMLDRSRKLWFIEMQPTPGAHFEGVKSLWGSIIDQQLEMLHHRRVGLPEYPPTSRHTFDPVPIINDWERPPARDTDFDGAASDDVWGADAQPARDRHTGEFEDATV